MSRITLGNRLYLYQLLSREVGVGRQAMLSRIEEVLRADDILPVDLGCDTIRELLEDLNDFVRLTVFKKGRVYATVIAQPEWDELLARAQTTESQKRAAESNGGPKSWKRKKAGKDPRPTKPRPRGREQIAQERIPQPQSEAEPESSQESAPATTASKDKPLESLPAEPLSESISEAESPIPPEPIGEAENPIQQEPTPEPKPEQDRPTQEQPSPSISLTVTYDPYEVEEGAAAQAEPFVETAPVSDVVPPSISLPPVEPPDTQRLFPQNFADEVLCGDEQLATLYRILPFDVSPLALLDEDWRVARSTETYSLNGGHVTFPLRYLQAQDGLPVQVSMKRRGKTASGKRWVLTSVGGSHPTLDSFTLNGLPVQDEGAWSELGHVTEHEPLPVSPLRELATTIALGPWDELLAQLANLAEPEDWGERRQTLQEYLAVTFHRIQCEEKLLVSPDEAHATFDTGLLTSQSRRVFASLTARAGDIPWQLEAFTTDASDTFIQRFEGLPQPAAYLSELADVTLPSPCHVSLAPTLTRTYGPSLEDAVRIACNHVQRSYRLATPAYDPQTNALRLLLPLSLDNEGIDHALVLASQKEGHLATSVLSLERARMCARVVSAALPPWL